MKGVIWMAENKRQAWRKIDEWQKTNVKRVVIKLNRNTDADILKELDKKESIQGYIKDAIRAYMK